MCTHVYIYICSYSTYIHPSMYIYMFPKQIHL